MAASATIELHLPQDLLIGGGASDDLAEHVARIGIERPLVVSDRFLLDQGPAGPLVERLQAGGASVATFGEVQPDPTLDNVEGALQALRDHEADGVVAIGGGSPMDTAKAAAVAFANPGDVRDYAGYNQIPGPGLPLVAVPTTAGTGSEVTRVAVITDTDRDVKMMMLDGHLMARVAISDYKLTMSTPADLTSWVGVDSLTHAIEAYVSTKATVLTDMLALEAARLIGAHMRRVVEHPDDEPAREAMMLGATLAGAAFSNSSVALVHGMSRPIGAHFHLAHGLSNALLLPTVTRFSVVGAPERYAHVAREMRLATDEDSDRVACDRLVDELEALNADLRIPSLSAAGVERDHFERVVQDMAQAALDSGSPGFNPEPASKEQIVELYHQAY
ncbi:MAG TPA: iron-containing alcohol dehydrogenase [Solirubrobacteraceae bacterium]